MIVQVTDLKFNHIRQRMLQRYVMETFANLKVRSLASPSLSLAAGPVRIKEKTPKGLFCEANLAPRQCYFFAAGLADFAVAFVAAFLAGVTFTPALVLDAAGAGAAGAALSAAR